MSEPLTRLRTFLENALVERRVEAYLAVLAVASGQHLLMLGPPGVAKTKLASLVGRAFGKECNYFELLLTRFTVDSEVFGPIRVKKLLQEEEEYVRKTTKYLPEAKIAFLDEIWKSNSAILNALLTIMNEREYDNGGQRSKVPLVSLFAGSNELPQDDSLEALYDRFLLRREVQRVGNPRALLTLAKCGDPPPVTSEDLENVRGAVQEARLTNEVMDRMVLIKESLAEKFDVEVSDRRFAESSSLVRASAVLRGNKEADPDDLLVLKHSYWRTPDQQGIVASVVDHTVDPEAVPPPQGMAEEEGHVRGTSTKRKTRGPGPAAGAGGPPPPPANTQGAQWQKVFSSLRGMTLEQIAGNPNLHNSIHQLLVAAEAKIEQNRESSAWLSDVKQKLTTKSMWRGPSW